MPSIVFYIGYARLDEKNYGSELALIQLSQVLKKNYTVKFLSADPNARHDEFEFLTHAEWKKGSFDILIISRYINFFLYLPQRAAKTFLWLHDVATQPAYKGQWLHLGGRYLLENTSIDGVVAQTEWHKNFFLEHFPGHTVHVIGNGLTKERFSGVLKKVPFLNIFPQIVEKYPLAKLHIFRGPEEFTEKQLSRVKEMKEIVTYHGFKENEELAEEFLISDFWLYPTDYKETFCISALEAQASGCLCIASDLAGLGEVVGDRGVLLKSAHGTEEYLEEIFIAIEYLHTEREKYSTAREWALTQTWEERGKKWIEISKY